MCSSSCRPWPAADLSLLTRSDGLGAVALAGVASVGLVIARMGGVAPAEEPTPPAAVPPAVPSLQITAAGARQIADDLWFELRFSRALPVAELEPARGRAICLVLSPGEPSRRQVCLRRRGGGRLAATIAAIDPSGAVTAAARPLRGARVDVSGGFLTLRAPAEALRVTLGRRLTYRASIVWQDVGPCSDDPSPAACAQVLPATGAQQLQTRVPRRPAFTRRGRLRLLATGDSMIQIVDGYLSQRLSPRRGATVRSDANISTAISKPAMLNWVEKARRQARAFKPDVAVVFLGANEGFPMKTLAGARVRCCDRAWVDEYARRAESMMRSYLRGGRSYVYWLTLPTPRRGDLARIYRAVNVAIRRAAARAGDGVRVIDLVPVFTPGWHFRQTVRFRGRTIDARQEDGVHLSTAGAAVAATIIIDRLRADHALP